MNRAEKKRLLTITFLGLIFACALLLFFPAKKKWSFYNKIINERVSQIQNYQQQVANKPLLTKEVERLSSIYHETGLFMKADSAESAGAALQTIIRDTLKNNDATIRSTEVTSSSTLPSGRAEVKVNVMFSSIDSFVTVFETFTSSKPALRVVTANVRPQSARAVIRVNNRPKNIMKQDGQVHVRMSIQAFYEEGGNSEK